THFANDVNTKVAVQRQKFRSQQEINWIAKPPGLDDVRAPVLTRFHIWNRAVAYRGYKRGIETYVNPWAAEDPGQPQVTSRIGDGFDLDGKIKSADFVSPDGEKGIDNNLYRAWGCDAPWRGNGNATLDLRANDKMQDGLYTMVIRVSGNKDPMNDNNVTLEIGYSPDKLVKDARGGIAVDYSYRILQTAQYTKLKAKIKNGVVETEQVENLHSPRIAWFYDQTGDANFSKGKIRMNMSTDGLTATGLIAGYRDWRELYTENTFAQDGAQQGIREHEDHVALYYALRRNADGILNSKTGKHDGISSVYRIRAASAYVVDPENLAMEVPKLPLDEKRMLAFLAIKANTIKGAETRVPQLVPPGTTEFGVGITEGLMNGLSSADFFMSTLYRQHYAGEDEDGYPEWMQEYKKHPEGGFQPKKPKKPAATQPAAQPAKPQNQVQNGDKKVANAKS
ncbi:MAG: hypothetical protein NTX21_00615, partial [Alphaproteobacteria bacterium]|nr:hypothetical protein [Alphaproteobacteria bacterium]